MLEAYCLTPSTFNRGVLAAKFYGLSICFLGFYTYVSHHRCCAYLHIITLPELELLSQYLTANKFAKLTGGKLPPGTLCARVAFPPRNELTGLPRSRFIQVCSHFIHSARCSNLDVYAVKALQGGTGVVLQKREGVIR